VTVAYGRSALNIALAGDQTVPDAGPAYERSRTANRSALFVGGGHALVIWGHMFARGRCDIIKPVDHRPDA